MAREKAEQNSVSTLQKLDLQGQDQYQMKFIIIKTDNTWGLLTWAKRGGNAMGKGII